MKTIKTIQPMWQHDLQTFRIPVIKVRRMPAISTATLVIVADKGIGSYRRKDKFDKGLTSFEQSV